ncbi:hypothetical protein KKI23_01305 [Patescibacteria group bacterium]|nr:hypothetical protein [Patescibacteria group bacterium]
MRFLTKIIKALLAALPASLFAGAVMISIALGSIFPEVDLIANSLVAIDGQKIIIEKQDYSYGPGQSGTVVKHLLINEKDEIEDVTFRLSVYSSLIYTVILMVLSLLAAGFYQFFRRLPIDALVTTAFGSSILLALLVTAVVVLFAVGSFINAIL